MAAQCQPLTMKAAGSEDTEEPEAVSEISVILAADEESPAKPALGRVLQRHRLQLFIAFLVFSNLVVIGVSIKAINTRETEEEERGGEGGEDGQEECPQHRLVVAPLCVPCEEGKDEGEEEGGWRRIRDDESDEDMCCPLDHRQLASAVHEIYKTVVRIKEKEILLQPPKAYSFFDEPSNTHETLLYTNRYKPSGHVTGVQRFDAEKFYVHEETQVICDWPMRVEPYLSVTTGYIQRLSWGLVVPTTGLYRVQASANFYFRYPQERKNDLQRRDRIPVIHQITRYQARDGSVSVLAQRNHTISSAHCDGLTSFLVATADLVIGDVISVNVSHESAMAMQDRWHTEGLFLIQ
ncbi:uncharacterized protein [Littorina saxatilis]|uniref:Uncharacterized protein n=1 Tax=Littorina saxatilis TaxID=31220 RepID=A0AAN9ANR3_9CAEN